MNSPRQGQQHRPSTWSRSRRDLASPQGLTLMIALMISFLLTIIALILESYLGVSKSVITIGLIISYIVVIAIAMSRIMAENKRIDEARRKAYQEKFGAKPGGKK